MKVNNKLPLKEALKQLEVQTAYIPPKAVKGTPNEPVHIRFGGKSHFGESMEHGPHFATMYNSHNVHLGPKGVFTLTPEGKGVHTKMTPEMKYLYEKLAKRTGYGQIAKTAAKKRPLNFKHVEGDTYEIDRGGLADTITGSTAATEKVDKYTQKAREERPNLGYTLEAKTQTGPMQYKVIDEYAPDWQKGWEKKSPATAYYGKTQGPVVGATHYPHKGAGTFLEPYLLRALQHEGLHEGQEGYDRYGWLTSVLGTKNPLQGKLRAAMKKNTGAKELTGAQNYASFRKELDPRMRMIKQVMAGKDRFIASDADAEKALSDIVSGKFSYPKQYESDFREVKRLFEGANPQQRQEMIKMLSPYFRGAAVQRQGNTAYG